MFSTFHGIEIGKKGLQTNNVGMDTVGHNLSNVETEGFSRQKVTLQSFEPLYAPSANRVEMSGQVGTGVEVQDIQRVRNQAIDDRINYEKGGLGYWGMKKEFLHQVEMVLNEPGKPNLRTVMDEYWSAWKNVADNPNDQASRAELIQRALAVTDTFKHNFGSLSDLRNNAEQLVGQRVNEINNMAEEIRGLNVQIVKSEAMGDFPNDMYDKRDLLVDKLAKIVDIKVERNNKHEVIIYVGAENLVQGEHVNKVHAVGNPDNDGFSDVLWADGRKVKLGGGELAGLIDVRDIDIRDAINQLDSLAVNMTDATNEVHRDGFGLNLSTDQNFFKSMPLSPAANGDYDFTNDGIVDGTALFKVSGTESVDLKSIVGSGGLLNFGPSKVGGPNITVEYQPTDTIEDVMKRINQSDAGVVTYINHKGQFSLKAKFPTDNRQPPFVMRHVEDSGNFLVGITGILNQNGAAGAFDYQNVNDITKFSVPEFNISFTPEKHAAGWINVDEAILANPDNIAVAGGIDTSGDGNPNQVNGLMDNRNALAISEIRHRLIMVESESTLGDYFKKMVGDMGTRSETAQVNLGKNKTVVDSLENLRKEISGVNVDEELTKMITFQHGYNASARLVSTMDRMLETLMRMGA